MSGIMVPWVADAASYVLRVKIGSTSENLTINFTNGRQYWRSSDLAADSAAGNGDLLGAVVAAINAQHTNGGAVSTDIVYVGDEPRMRVSIGSSDIKFAWADAATTFPPDVLGFTSSDTAEAASITAPNRLPGLWLPGADLTDDSRDRYQPRRGVRESLSGLVYASDFGDAAVSREVGWTLVPQRYVLTEYAQAAGEDLQTFWVNWISKGQRFRLYDDATGSGLGAGSFGTYRVADVRDPADRNGRYPFRWDVALRLRGAA